MNAFDVGFADRDEFKQGVHWMYQDAPEDILWVSFTAAGMPAGHFNTVGSLRGFPGKKLFIGDPTSTYYQTQITDISDLLKYISKKHSVSRAIYWGSSMGAYAALLFGILGIIPGVSYAFAPQFCLYHLFTHAAHWIKDREKFHPYFADLRPLLKVRGFSHLNIFLPCFHYMDGVQIRDMELLGDLPETVAITATSHRALEDIMAKLGHEILDVYFTAALRSETLQVPPEFIPSAQDIELGVRSYSCIEHIAGRAERPDTNIDDRSTLNHGWLNAKLRLLAKEENFSGAVAAGLRSIELAPTNSEYLICLANVYGTSNFTYGQWFAEALYRQCLRIDPRNEGARRGLVNSLNRRGLRREAEAVPALPPPR